MAKRKYKKSEPYQPSELVLVLNSPEALENFNAAMTERERKEAAGEFRHLINCPHGGIHNNPFECERAK